MTRQENPGNATGHPQNNFLNDRAIRQPGIRLTQVMIQFPRQDAVAASAILGEAWLYVVEGSRHSFLGIAPD
jgi:hypothetical protein